MVYSVGVCVLESCFWYDIVVYFRLKLFGSCFINDFIIFIVVLVLIFGVVFLIILIVE